MWLQIEASMKKNGREFMWNERLGYLCACPSNIGTGLRCSAHIQLKLLSKVSTRNQYNCMDTCHYQDIITFWIMLTTQITIRCFCIWQRDDFEKIVKAMQMQPRGTGGEHTEAIDSVYDISNSARLKKTEVSLLFKYNSSEPSSETFITWCTDYSILMFELITVMFVFTVWLRAGCNWCSQ